jgi:transposase-like protein
MNGKVCENRGAIRYSEAFKMEVVREVEAEGKSFHEVRRKYGIGGCDTVQNWVRRYGNGTRGKILRVEKPEEINELKQLRERTRRLEKALADANLDLALERQYTRLACQRAGIENVEEFKKKAAGKQPMEP